MNKGTLICTGGVGFIGTNISLEARRRGYEVIAFDSLIRKGSEENIAILQKHGVEIFRGDVRNQEDFGRLPKREIVGIWHGAGNPGIPWSIAHPLYDFEVNAQGTINVLEYSRTHGKIPVIYASTNKCYSDMINTIPLKEQETRYEWNQPKEGWMDGVTPRGINEGFTTDGFQKYPHSPYGASKLTGDTYCQEYFHTYDVPVVINRMSCIYGLYQKGVEDQGWIDFFIRSIGMGDGKINIYGDGKQVRDMLFGSDVANLYLDELEKISTVKGNVFNVGGGIDNTLSLIEAISYIENISGKGATLEFKPWRHADQRIYISDTTKVQKALGWKPTVSPKQGIQLMLDEYKSK
jgi:CDP-paratose 2-epimerase